MSSSPPNYMDGVPVKISEKYRPPPPITMPQAIINRLNSEGYPTECFDYDFTLEKNVIEKIDEWRRVREIQKIERQDRLRKYESRRVKELEERQKQMLTAVSYPSADDLSSSSEDGADVTTESPEDISSGGNTYHEPVIASAAGCSGTVFRPNQFSPSFDTILMPTVLPESNCNKPNWVPTAFPNGSPSGKINYSDFENLTASPFDNCELKTINDLDILAQVLKVQKIHSTIADNANNISSNKIPIDEINNSEDYKNQTNLSEMSNTKNISSESNNRSSNVLSYNLNTFQSTQQQPAIQTFDDAKTEGFIKNSDYDEVGQNSYNYQLPHQQQNSWMINNNPISLNPFGQQNYCNNYLQLQANQQQFVQNFNNVNGDFAAASTNYYNQHYCNPNPNYSTNFYSAASDNTTGQENRFQSSLQFYNVQQMHNDNDHFNTISRVDNADNDQNSFKSKSKSVPDILKELNNEIRDSEIRRARNHSQTLEDHTREINVSPNYNTPGISSKSPESFMKLSPSSQRLVHNISLMGFPLERVSKIAQKLGNDDKKIFEHLIPLSELLDLGFDEAKISDALLKFNNNKEKALDFLIS